MNRTQFKKLTRESPVCVLCGEESATTKEHVPPQSLFLKSPRDYLRVPACVGCNSSSKLDDEHLRLVLTGSSQTEEALELWRQKVRPKLHSFPRTRAGLAQNLKPGILTHPVLGRFPVPILLIEAKRIEVSIRKMVWGLHWFHTGKIMPKRESFGLQMLNTAQVANYFNDPENERIFKATKPGIYRDPAVVRTFFYTCATSASSTLWYFFFYRQNIAIAYTGELADLVDEPSNPPLNVTSPQDAPAG